MRALGGGPVRLLGRDSQQDLLRQRHAGAPGPYHEGVLLKVAALQVDRVVAAVAHRRQPEVPEERNAVALGRGDDLRVREGHLQHGGIDDQQVGVGIAGGLQQLLAEGRERRPGDVIEVEEVLPGLFRGVCQEVRVLQEDLVVRKLALKLGDHVLLLGVLRGVTAVVGFGTEIQQGGLPDFRLHLGGGLQGQLGAAELRVLQRAGAGVDLQLAALALGVDEIGAFPEHGVEPAALVLCGRFHLLSGLAGVCETRADAVLLAVAKVLLHPGADEGLRPGPREPGVLLGPALRGLAVHLAARAAALAPVGVERRDPAAPALERNESWLLLVDPITGRAHFRGDHACPEQAHTQLDELCRSLVAQSGQAGHVGAGARGHLVGTLRQDDPQRVTNGVADDALGVLHLCLYRHRLGVVQVHYGALHPGRVLAPSDHREVVVPWLERFVGQVGGYLQRCADRFAGGILAPLAVFAHALLQMELLHHLFHVLAAELALLILEAGDFGPVQLGALLPSGVGLDVVLEVPTVRRHMIKGRVDDGAGSGVEVSAGALDVFEGLLDQVGHGHGLRMLPLLPGVLEVHLHEFREVRFAIVTITGSIGDGSPRDEVEKTARHG
mmetsp:Transcript_16199/g.38468  ORF Transcript_16199/g.38468 Transcript_16199/m.38468 type:complete len:610 (-) Transcript_16199:48-1877(-)